MQELRGMQPTLWVSTYSLTLLKPRESGCPRTEAPRASRARRLQRRGQRAGQPHRRRLLQRVSHPAQISAELNEIPASRVYNRADFAPRWTQWPYSKRVELAIASPRLAKHDTHHGDRVGRGELLSKEPGNCLGFSATTSPPAPCPTPAAAPRSNPAGAMPPRTRPTRSTWMKACSSKCWISAARARRSCCCPDSAPRPTPSTNSRRCSRAKHRVIAMTRRGTGYSSKPDFGFDTPTLAQGRAAGDGCDEARRRSCSSAHSIAGDELTWFGGHHADRFSGLVYLDAAYDRSGDPKARRREDACASIERTLPPEPPPAAGDR